MPGVRGEISDSEYGHQPYSITVHIDEALAGISANGIMDQLKNTEPRVWVRAVRSSAALGRFAHWTPWLSCSRQICTNLVFVFLPERVAQQISSARRAALTRTRRVGRPTPQRS